MAVHLRRGFLPPAHGFPQSQVALQVAQAGVSPQPGNNLGWLTQLGKEAGHQTLGLGPQGLGLAAGLDLARAGDSVSHIRTVPSPEPDARLLPSGLKASEKT